MAGSTYSTNLKIELMSTGENSGTWGDITNTNLGTALEQAIVGYGNPDYVADANLTITISNSNSAQAARALVLNVTSVFGSLTATRELVVPTIQKQYIVQNNTTGGQSITVKTSAGTGITVPNGRKAHLYVDGTNVIQMFDFVDINGGTIDGATVGASSASSGAFTTLTASGATTLNGSVALGDASGDLITFPGTVNSNLLFTDNTYDIGASGATRPRNLYLAGAATIGGNLSVGGTLTLTGGVNLNGNVTVGDSSSDTLTINSTITSNLLFTDNTYDIGASGATRPRNLFLAGNATVGGSQTLTGSLTVDSTTDSSSTTTGSIQTDGGLGVAKAAYIGTNLNVAGNTTLGDASADTVTVNSTITSNLIFTDNTYDIGASAATRPRTGYFATSVNIQSGENTYGLWVGPTTGTWSVGGSTGIAFLVRNTAGGGVGGDGGGAYIEAYQPTNGNTGGLKFKTRENATTVTTRYTIDDTGVGTWSVGGNATAMSLNATGLGLNQTAGNGTLTILKASTYTTESSAAICLNSVNTNGYTSLQIGVDDAINAAYIQSVAKGTSYTSKFLLLNPNGGNVGIGNVTAPANLLTVAKTGGAATVQIVSNTAGQNTQVVFSSTVASWYIGQNITESSTGSLEFYNGTKQVSIASTGATYFAAQGAAGYGAININNPDPFLRYTVTTGTANKSKWDVRAISTGSTSAGNMLEFRTINDANSTFRSLYNMSYDGMFVVNPNQDNTGSLVRLYGGGTSERGGYYSGDGTFSAGSSNYWEFGRDNAITGDFTFALNTNIFWRMTTTGQWNRTLTTDLAAINIYGSYTGNPEMVSIGQSSSDGYIRIKDAVGNTTFLTGYNAGVSYFASKVSIGTSSPTSYFGSNFVVAKNGADVVGFVDSSGAAGGTVQTNKAGANGSDSTTSYIVFQRSDGVDRGSIVATGTNGVVYNTTSDYRLKTVVGPVSGAGERIDALEPIEYIWNQDGSTERGFLAHKFKEVYSRSVSGEKDEVGKDGKPKYQSMQASSGEVMADLVAEIQSLRKRLAAAGIA